MKILNWYHKSLDFVVLLGSIVQALIYEYFLNIRKIITKHLTLTRIFYLLIPAFNTILLTILSFYFSFGYEANYLLTKMLFLGIITGVIFHIYYRFAGNVRANIMETGEIYSEKIVI